MSPKALSTLFEMSQSCGTHRLAAPSLLAETVLNFLREIQHFDRTLTERLERTSSESKHLIFDDFSISHVDTLECSKMLNQVLQNKVFITNPYNNSDIG